MNTKTYDSIFKSLGDPHRMKIITLLREQELNAGEILQELDIGQSTLSHHMKTLIDSGMVNAMHNVQISYQESHLHGVLEPPSRSYRATVTEQ